MGLRECIQIHYSVDVDSYLDVLKSEYGAIEHPHLDGAYLIDGLPFYKPQLADTYIFILGFNMTPLSSVLIQALAENPDLVPVCTKVCWTLEQELILVEIF